MHERCWNWLAVSLMFCSWAEALPAFAQETGNLQSTASLTIDWKNALERARANSPQFQSAGLGVELAQQDRYLAKTAFLPTVNAFNQYIYTQGNGTPSGMYVANDGVHVYSSQAAIHEELYAPARMSEYRRAVAAEAVAVAKREVALRGLAATVLQNYYQVIASERHLANARQSLEESRQFAEITQKLEAGGEVAHSDVVKAQLTLRQRERDMQDAQLAIDKARIGLAVLLFPDYRTDFRLVDDLENRGTLPPLEQVVAVAGETNPDLHAAEQTVRQEEFGVAMARGAYLPSLSFDYWFGINANQFAYRDREGLRQLGSAAQATLNIPIFNWWETRTKIRQADLKRQQAQLDLVLTRRQLQSTLQISYAEARTALAQLNSLRQSVDLAAESLRLTNLRYQAGEVTVLEVVDAQSTLVQARNGYDDGLAKYRLALGNIQILTGNY